MIADNYHSCRCRSSVARDVTLISLAPMRGVADESALHKEKEFTGFLSGMLDMLLLNIQGWFCKLSPRSRGSQ